MSKHDTPRSKLPRRSAPPVPADRAKGRLVLRYREPNTVELLRRDEGEKGLAAQGTTLGSTALKKILLDEFGSRGLTEKNLHLFDDFYYLPTIAEIEDVVRRSPIARREHILNRFDCDDFAFGLKGEVGTYAYTHGEKLYGVFFGVIEGAFAWGDNHVACVGVDEKQKPFLIEPQADILQANPGRVLFARNPAECERCGLVLV